MHDMQGFSVSGCGCAHVLWNIFRKVFPRDSDISALVDKGERRIWYACYRSFQSCGRWWDSEIALREEFVQLPPCDWNDLHINKWLWDRTRIVCTQGQGTGLWFYNHSDLTAPSYRTKPVCWGNTATQPRPWPYTWVLNFTFTLIPFLT